MTPQPAWRDPKGVAHWDYDSECPGCGRRMLAGEAVRKIVLPRQRALWWHEECRRLERKRLILGPEQSGDLRSGDHAGP